MNGEKLVIDVWVPSVIMIRITIIPSFSRRFDIQNVSDDARRKGAHCTVGLKWEKVISQNCLFTQCENFGIFLSFRFYVKSILGL